LAGALLSVAKVALIVSVLLMIASGFSAGGSLLSEEEEKKSYLYPRVAQLGPMIVPALTRSDWWDEIQQRAKALKEYVIPEGD